MVLFGTGLPDFGRRGNTCGTRKVNIFFFHFFSFFFSFFWSARTRNLFIETEIYFSLMQNYKNSGNPGWLESFLLTLLQSGSIYIAQACASEIKNLRLVIAPAEMLTRAGTLDDEKNDVSFWQDCVETFEVWFSYFLATNELKNFFPFRHLKPDRFFFFLNRKHRTTSVRSIKFAYSAPTSLIFTIPTRICRWTVSKIKFCFFKYFALFFSIFSVACCYLECFFLWGKRHASQNGSVSFFFFFF